MPKARRSRDRLRETNDACVAKFHCVASDMIRKHGVTFAGWSNGLNAKRAGKAKHSRRLFSQHRTVGLVLAVLGGCALGCAAPRANTAGPHSAAKYSTGAQAPLEVPRSVITPARTTDIPALFAEATAEGQAQRYDAAARAFDRAFELDPDGPLAAKSLFEAAEMFDLAAEQEAALARYEQVARRFPDSELDRIARVRALRLLAYLEHYQRAGELAELTANKYRDLHSLDQIAVLAARALARLALADDVQAEYFVSKARDIIERENLDAAGRVPQELAPVYFALGEVRRLRAERIHFLPVPENFAGALEQRCQLLLDAQSAYSDAMRAYDAHWSTMAGFRVGELYQKLHEELMQVPAPKEAGTERQRQLFEGAMRLRYSTLLAKAKTMMDHTVTMADRTGEQSPWVLKARQARDAINQAIRDENDALAKLPYTREQLQAALDSFASGHAP
jgi:tetratricopeptide (TPR) repeat protein